MYPNASARKVAKRKARESKYQRQLEKFNQSLDDNLVLLQNLENMDSNSIMNYHSDFDDNHPDGETPDNMVPPAQKTPSKNPFNQTNALRHKRGHASKRGAPKRSAQKDSTKNAKRPPIGPGSLGGSFKI